MTSYNRYLKFLYDDSPRVRCLTGALVGILFQVVWSILICNMKTMYRNILLQRWTWWSSLLFLYLSYRPLKLTCCLKPIYRSILVQRWTWWSPLLLLSVFYRSLKLTCDLICNMKAIYRSILVQRWPWWNPLLLLSFSYRPLKLHAELLLDKDHSGIS